jgi:hypothetical protein
MSISDLLAQWPTYQTLTKAMYLGINFPGDLKNVIDNIGPFPENDPSAWNTWASAYDALGALNDAVQVTDATLQGFADAVAATNKIAATVVLAAPSQQQVADLVNQMNVVNKAIQSDHRFSAALKIGKALAGTINANLKKK